MKNNNILILLVITFILVSCKKEEVTNEYITNVNGPEVFIYSQEGLPDILRDIEPSAEVWTLNDQITSIELGPLNEGDIVVAETQIRVRDQADCDFQIGINSGPLISSSILSVPTLDADDPSILAFEEDGPVRVELMPSDLNSVYFERTYAAVINTSVTNAYATFWLNAYTSNCPTTDGEGISAELGVMVISVYRN